MTGIVRIDSGVLRAEISPRHGAGLVSLAFNGTELLHPAPIRGLSTPIALGSMLLVPWSNRISGGGFSFEGHFHPLSPNREGEPYPIHGNGFQCAWTLVAQTGTSAELRLASVGPGPFAYDAVVVYRLDGATIEMSLKLVNRAPIRLPYGLGFHPWLRRTPGTNLHAPAVSLWLQRPDDLLDRPVLPSARPEWDFSTPRPLPSGAINNGFAGWNRTARVVWPELATALLIEASETLSTYILYSPSAAASFFCFEPVTHPINAHNLPGGPAANGLIVLDRDAQTSASFTMSATEV